MNSRIRAFVIGFVLTVFASVAYALTTSQILNSVYDSANTALRINQVTP